MANMIRTPSSPGIKIENSIIEEYYAETETINANTFVEFVNGKPTLVKKNASSTDAELRAACVLDDQRVLCIYSKGGGKTDYPFGVVLTINRTEITVGTPLLMSTLGYYSSQCIKLLKIGTDKVFFALQENSDDNICFRILEISGDSITIGRNTYSSYSGSRYSIDDIFEIDTNDIGVIITYNDLYFVRCTVSGTSISIITELSANITATYCKAARVAYDKDASYRFALVAFVGASSTSASSWNVYCWSLDLFSEASGNGNEMTELSLGYSIESSYYQSLSAIFISSNSNNVYFILCDQFRGVLRCISVSSSNTITLETITTSQSPSLSADGHYLSRTELNKNGNILYLTVQMSYNSTPSYYYCIAIEKFELVLDSSNVVTGINSLGVIELSDVETKSTQTHNSFISFFLNNYSSIFYLYHLTTGSGDSVYARHYYFEDLVKASVDKIDGLTKSKVTMTQKGKIFTLGGN